MLLYNIVEIRDTDHYCKSPHVAVEYMYMDWRYVAGFFDGEGSIVKTPVYRYRIFVTQTNEEVLKKIQAFTGVGSVVPITKRKKHWKNAWIYYISSSENILRFLRHIQPYLIVKKELASHAIKNLEIRKKQRMRQERLLEHRIKGAKKLRAQGLPYRKIGRILRMDFGYARRLVKFH